MSNGVYFDRQVPRTPPCRGQGAQYKMKIPCREAPPHGRGVSNLLLDYRERNRPGDFTRIVVYRYLNEENIFGI